MAGPWSSGFSSGFGPILTEVSSKKPSAMQILGFTSTEKLLFDYGESEQFYILEIKTSMLFGVSPLFASKWFGLNGNNVTVVYNPFLGTSQALSNVFPTS